MPKQFQFATWCSVNTSARPLDYFVKYFFLICCSALIYQTGRNWSINANIDFNVSFKPCRYRKHMALCQQGYPIIAVLTLISYYLDIWCWTRKSCIICMFFLLFFHWWKEFCYEADLNLVDSIYTKFSSVTHNILVDDVMDQCLTCDRGQLKDGLSLSDIGTRWQAKIWVHVYTITPTLPFSLISRYE